jgi:hypothetical protein
MGKYSKRQVPPPQRPWAIHPIWRGIGCVMLLIAPFIAFAAADLLVKQSIARNWIPIPPEMRNIFRIPQLNYTIHNLYADLIVAGLLLLMGFGVIMIIYSILYSIMGPGRSPLDAGPIRDNPAAQRKRR